MITSPRSWPGSRRSGRAFGSCDRDVVCGIAASGRTPYVLGALDEARRRGAGTVGVTTNCGSEMEDRVDVLIAPVVGAEPVSGSTRMKSGTAQKLVLNMLTTMSKFLNIGLTIEQIIERTTVNAARAIKRPDLGHLGVGAEADLAVLNLRRGKFGFIDTGGGKMMGDQKLECELTIKGGQVMWDLNGISRPLWSDMKPPTGTGASR